MPEMKVKLEMAAVPGVTVTYEFARVVDSEEEAREAGEDDKRLVDAYQKGYGNA